MKPPSYTSTAILPLVRFRARTPPGRTPWPGCCPSVYLRYRYNPEVILTTYLSRGLYSLPAAAALIGAKRRDLDRWAFGYHSGGNWYPPAIHADLESIDDDKALSFLDLVELMFIHGLRASGRPFPMIHEAHAVLARLLDTEHPFALRAAFTDPGGIYALLDREDQGELLIELKGAGQISMWPALERYLHQLDFDMDDLARRWYPAGRGTPIVVDPKISFGAPVVQGTRIETRALAELFQGEDSVDELAWLYDISPAQVRAAVEFERSLAA